MATLNQATIPIHADTRTLEAQLTALHTLTDTITNAVAECVAELEAIRDQHHKP